MKHVLSKLINVGKGNGKFDMNLNRRIRTLNKKIKQLKKNEDSGGEAGCYEEMGLLYFERLDYDKAVEYWQEALRVYQEINDRKSMAESYSNIGTAYRMRGDLQKAARFYNKALVLDKSFENDEGEVISHHNLGGTLLDSGQFEGACESYEAALKMARESRLRDWEIMSLYRLGTALAAWHRYGDALIYFRDGFRLAEEDRRLDMLVRCTLGMGESYEFLGEYDQALMCYDDAVSGAKNLEDDFLYAWSLTRKGWLMVHLGCFKEGRHLADSAFGKVDGKAPRALRIMLYLLKARFYAHRGLWQNAEKMIREAKEIAMDLPYGYFTAKVLLMQARFLLEKKQYEDALGIILEKDGRFKPGISLVIDVETALIQGRIYQVLEKNEKASEASLSAVLLAEKLGVPRYLWRAYHSLGKWYHFRQQFSAARDQYQAALKWVDKAALRLTPDIRRIFLDVRDRQDVYKDFILLQLRTGHKESAIQTLKRLGSQSLNDKLKHFFL